MSTIDPKQLSHLQACAQLCFPDDPPLLKDYGPQLSTVFTRRDEQIVQICKLVCSQTKHKGNPA